MKVFTSYRVDVLRGPTHKFFVAPIGKFTPKGVRLRSLGTPKDFLEIYGELELGYPPSTADITLTPTPPAEYYIYTTKSGWSPQEWEEFIGSYIDESGDIIAVYFGSR